MADSDTDTSGTTEGTQGAEGSNTDPAANASATGDDASLLRSRLSGQTAKVNQLQAERDTIKAERDALALQVAAAQKGEVNKDEALKAQIAAKDTELAAIRQEAALARIEAKYPEAYAELGELAANMPADKLAALEARLTNAQTDEEPPSPRGNNGPRTTGAAKPREESSQDILAKLKAQGLPW